MFILFNLKEGYYTKALGTRTPSCEMLWFSDRDPR